MSWSPLNTLTGRMVLVTIIAVLASHAIVFWFYASERSEALRRANEASVVERVAALADRMRAAPSELRGDLLASTRARNRFQIADTPVVTEPTPRGAATRVARALSAELDGAEVRAALRRIPRRPPPHHERPIDRGDRHGPPHHSELLLSVNIGDGQWLNGRAHLIGPRPLPTVVIAGALISVLLVGLGAAFVSRQIGRPLAQLANAARAFGSGEAGVSAPVTGPQDVRRAAVAFNSMTERLGRQIGRQRQMLWALSHDLRTPITAIRLRAELIEDDATRQRLLAPVSEMETLTEQALSLARAGASDEAKRAVDLADIAQTLAAELRDLGLNIQAETNEPVIATCRPTEIARAIRNLAENAAKYAGGGVIRVTRGSEREAIIEVIDEGPGAPSELIARLAEPFWRADQSRSQAEGAGLGLAIVQAIVDAHGGALVLKNRDPRGFLAAIVLPI